MNNKEDEKSCKCLLCSKSTKFLYTIIVPNSRPCSMRVCITCKLDKFPYYIDDCACENCIRCDPSRILPSYIFTNFLGNLQVCKICPFLLEYFTYTKKLHCVICNNVANVIESLNSSKLFKDSDELYCSPIVCSKTCSDLYFTTNKQCKNVYTMFHLCNYCQSYSNNMLICSNCRTFRYCSKECAFSHVNRHNAYCKKISNISSVQ